MLLREVSYARPGTVEEAIELLARHDGARALAESPYVGNLWYLDVNHTGLTSLGRTALAESPHLRSVTVNPIPGGWNLDDER